MQLDGSNVYTTLPLASAYAFTTIGAPHSAITAFPQPTFGLLPLPVETRAPSPIGRMTRDFMFTGQHSNAFTFLSHLATATNQSRLKENPDIFLNKGPSADEGPSAHGPSIAWPSPPLLDLQFSQPRSSMVLPCFIPKLKTLLWKEWNTCSKSACHLLSALGCTTSRLLRTCNLPLSFLRIASSYST